MSVRVLVMD